MMWYVVVMAALFYVTIALPFGLFYSETDEEKEFVSNITSWFNTLSAFNHGYDCCYLVEMAHMLVF